MVTAEEVVLGGVATVGFGAGVGAEEGVVDGGDAVVLAAAVVAAVPAGLLSGSLPYSLGLSAPDAGSSLADGAGSDVGAAEVSAVGA